MKELKESQEWKELKETWPKMTKAKQIASIIAIISIAIIIVSTLIAVKQEGSMVLLLLLSVQIWFAADWVVKELKTVKEPKIASLLPEK